MRHFRCVTCSRPAKAQFEVFIQLISLISSFLSVLDQVSRLFGLDFSDKGGAPS